MKKSESIFFMMNDQDVPTPIVAQLVKHGANRLAHG